MEHRNTEVDHITIEEETKQNKLSHLFQFDAKASISEILPMSLQHVIAAIGGIVTPGIIVAGACGLSSSDTTIMIQTSLIFSGISTLVQIFTIGKRIGSRLPLMIGAGFAYVPILLLVGSKFGLPTLLGAQAVGSLFAILIGLNVKKLRVLLPPIVTGTVILSIGLSLFPVAIQYMAGGAGSTSFGSMENWLVALITFAVVFYFNYFSKGILKLSSILNGMVVGYIVSLLFGMVDFTSFKEASFFQVIKPFQFGMKFHLIPILTLVVIMMVNTVSDIGQITATTMGAYDKEPTDRELSGGIVGNGFSNVLGSLFGATPVAVFGQNVGLVTVTKVVNKYVFIFASVIMLVAGFIPKFTSILTTIPYPVIGGATISVFASISITGIKMISSQKFTPQNTALVGIALAFGTGVCLTDDALAGFPEWVTMIFGNSEVIVTTLVAVTLNLIFRQSERRAKKKIKME